VHCCNCNQQGCNKEGDEVYDWYGIYAGQWCEEHEKNAPGQWPYDGPDTEPLEEEEY